MIFVNIDKKRGRIMRPLPCYTNPVCFPVSSNACHDHDHHRDRGRHHGHAHGRDRARGHFPIHRLSIDAHALNDPNDLPCICNPHVVVRPSGHPQIHRSCHVVPILRLSIRVLGLGLLHAHNAAREALYLL